MLSHLGTVAPSAATVDLSGDTPAIVVTDLPTPARRRVVGGYFRMFRTCCCGHSSGWHAGAFESWRAGRQAAGGCEFGRDGAGPPCACRRFEVIVEAR